MIPPPGSCVCVTILEAPTLIQSAQLWILHLWYKERILTQSSAVDVRINYQPRAKRVTTTSCWADIQSVRRLGESKAHVSMAHLVMRDGRVKSTSYLYSILGEWKEVLWRDQLDDNARTFGLRDK